MLIFYSDPHIGLNRRANTTTSSRAKFQREITAHLESVLSYAKEEFGEDSKVICGGDFFDKHSNKESIIVSAVASYKLTDLIIAGNHDVLNNTSSVGSLLMMDEVVSSVGGDGRSKTYVAHAAVGSSSYSVHEYHDDNCVVYAVPHHSTQELFETALENAAEDCKSDNTRYTKVLLTHCNYDLSEDHVKNDTTLVMTADDANYLLDDCGFDYIFLGHDHSPKLDHDGRVVVMGSTMPTSFSDIGSKYIYTLSSDGELDSRCIWSKDAGYVQLSINRVEDWPSSFDTGVMFVEVTGEVEASKRSWAVAEISKLFDIGEYVLAVRDSVSIIDADKINSNVIPELPTARTVRDVIAARLKDTDLFDLWEKKIKEVESNAN